MELWKAVEEYWGYEVSNEGSVRSLDRWVEFKDGRRRRFAGTRLKAHRTARGYLQAVGIGLRHGGPAVNPYIHRLVATAFIANPGKRRTVNHKNGDRTDNRVENLEWATHSENQLHAYRELGRVPHWLGKTGRMHPKSSEYAHA